MRVAKGAVRARGLFRPSAFRGAEVVPEKEEAARICSAPVAAGVSPKPCREDRRAVVIVGHSSLEARRVFCINVSKRP